MNLKRIFIIAGCLFMLTACINKPADETREQQNQGLELTKLTTNSPVDQRPANKAKQILSNHDEVKSVRAVNHEKQMIVGIQLKHHDRINMDKIERDLRKEIKKDFPKMTVTLSTDEKIHLEIEKIEKALQKDQHISKDELKKKMKKVKLLSEEKT